GLGGFLTDRIGATKTVVTSGFIGVVGFGLFPLWVHDGFSFTISSIVAGVGFGILLGAPLNVLVGESAKEAEQGSALGTLSLVRQVVLTLFPTIYAGFITGGFTKAGTTVVAAFPETVEELGLRVSSFTQSNIGETIDTIETLPNEEIKTSMLESIFASIQSGYNILFIVSSLLAIIVIGVGYNLHIRQKESETRR